MKKRLSNPLALAVLVLLFERPMHPYEMAATLRERGKEKSIKLHYGSLYTVIDLLGRAQYIVPTETIREGRRPEKTTYAITQAGEEEMNRWLEDLLSNPVKEYPRFEAALSLLPALLPQRAATLLAERLTRLDDAIKKIKAEIKSCQAQNLPRLFLIESEYTLALIQAERTYIGALVKDIQNHTLSGLDLWQQFHRSPENTTAAAHS